MKHNVIAAIGLTLVLALTAAAVIYIVITVLGDYAAKHTP